MKMLLILVGLFAGLPGVAAGYWAAMETQAAIFDAAAVVQRFG